LHEVSDERIYEIFEERGVYSNPEVLEWIRELLAEVKLIEENIARGRGALTALDIGTGGSASLFALLKMLRGCWVISLDTSVANIVNSRRKLREKEVRGEYDHMMQDAEHLGFRGNSFDLVCSVLTAHEISSKGREYEGKSRSFCEMVRVCSVERYVVIVDTCEEFHGFIRHSHEAVAEGKVSFITGEEVRQFMREAFPENQVKVKPFQSGSGTGFFIVVMRKLSAEDFSRMQDIPRRIAGLQTEIQRRMLDEYTRYLMDSNAT